MTAGRPRARPDRRPCGRGPRGCRSAPAPSRAAASTRAVLLPVESVLRDVALYRARNEEADRSIGCDASADGGGRDIEAGDALQAQHVPRLVKERLTARIVPEGFASRKWNVLDGELLGPGWARHDDDVAQREERRVLPPGLEVAEGVESHDERDP